MTQPPQPETAATQPIQYGITLHREYPGEPPHTGWVQVTLGTKVSDILQAEQTLLGPAHTVSGLSDHWDKPMSPDDRLQPNASYVLRAHGNQQGLPENMAVTIHCGQATLGVHAKPGHRLCELNHRLGLPSHTTWTDRQGRPRPPDTLIEPHQEYWTGTPPAPHVGLCIRLGGSNTEPGEALPERQESNTMEDTPRGPEPLPLGLIAQLAQRRSQTQHESLTFQYLPRQDPPFDQWRLTKLIQYHVWLGTDEATVATGTLRWYHPRDFYFSRPMVYHQGDLIPHDHVMEATKVACIILLDSHWVGLEAERNQKTWRFTFLEATPTQEARLLPLVASRLRPPPDHPERQTVLLPPSSHLCGSTKMVLVDSTAQPDCQPPPLGRGPRSHPPRATP